MLEQPISLSTDKAVFQNLTDSTDRDNLHLVSELLLDHDVPFVVLRDDYTRNTCLSGRLNLVRHAANGQHFSANRKRSGHCYRLIHWNCLLYTSDAADDLLCVDLGGRRIIKKKKNI